MSDVREKIGKANMQAPLTVLWRRTTLDRFPESWFIHNVLLGGLDRSVRVVAVDRITDAPFADGVLVASLTTEWAPYLEEARRRGQERIGLLHLGDEQNQDDLAFYDNADLVLRNYWFADVVDGKKVHWVPNGYALGVGPRASVVPTSQRAMPGFFAGAFAMRALSDERASMRAVVERAGLPFRIHATATPRDKLGPASYAAALCDAQFALVPGGNSPETIRLYDALECGAIPIMLRSAFVPAETALDSPPLLLLDSWDELPRAYETAVAGNVDALQRKITEWWHQFQQRQKAKVARELERVLAL